MDALITALPIALSAEAVIAVLAGSFIGLVFGSIPGLTFTVALALVLPMSFSLEATPAIGLLLGTYIGGMTGGSVSAILLGIPGTPSAAATVIDGYQLTRRGKASLALGTAVIVSVFGGLLSLLVMIVSVDFVARMAIKFGPAEIFALVVFGLSTICGLSGQSMLRGLIAGCIGLMAMTIGLDELEGAQRLTFGITTMQQFEELILRLVVGAGITNARDGKLRVLNAIVFGTAFSERTTITPNHGRMTKIRIDTVKATRVGDSHVDVVTPRHGFAHQDLLFLGGVHVACVNSKKNQ